MNKKICTKCQEEKPLTGFHKSKHHKTGYRSHCKVCIRRYNSTPEQRQKSRERSLKFSKTQKGKEYKQAYNKSDKAKQSKRRYKKSPAGRNAEVRYRQSSQGKKTRQDWLENNFNKASEYQKRADRKYRENPKNRDKIRARKAIWYAKKSGKIPRAEALTCSMCGDNQASHYHHHKGYDDKYKLDVIPVCIACHISVH